jgi:hypothetical protein
MLCIRFSKKSGCDISAKPLELRAIAEVILRLASSGSGSHTFFGDISISAKPYDQLLHQLAISVTTGPICATVNGDTLNICGGSEYLKPFASFFDFDDKTPSGHHNHHEYFEGNSYVSPNSTPLVIGVGGKILVA